MDKCHVRILNTYLKDIFTYVYDCLALCVYVFMSIRVFNAFRVQKEQYIPQMAVSCHGSAGNQM